MQLKTRAKGADSSWSNKRIEPWEREENKDSEIKHMFPWNEGSHYILYEYSLIIYSFTSPVVRTLFLKIKHSFLFGILS